MCTHRREWRHISQQNGTSSMPQLNALLQRDRRQLHDGSLRTWAGTAPGTSVQAQREQALAKTAFALMAECGVAPTPANYELFYQYATGSDPYLAGVMSEQ